MPQQTKARPGGRSERIKSAIFDAFEMLIQEHAGELPTIAEIASTAGVNPTSLYRRWGDAKGLAAAVAVERMSVAFPIPDTGSLQEDLAHWGCSAARSISGPKDGALLRIMATTAHARSEATGIRKLPIEPRIAELESMLARAQIRGEPSPSVWDVLEIVLSPIYLHILFLGPIEDEQEYVAHLVARVLILTPGTGEAG